LCDYDADTSARVEIERRLVQICETNNKKDGDNNNLKVEINRNIA
jgi:hypothetical protein